MEAQLVDLLWFRIYGKNVVLKELREERETIEQQIEEHRERIIEVTDLVRMYLRLRLQKVTQA